MAGRNCSVCASPKLAQINKSLLIAGGSKRVVAERFGLNAASIQRHRSNCLNQKTLQATAPRTDESSGAGPKSPNEPGSVRFGALDGSVEPASLIALTARLVDEALDLLQNAKKADDRRTALTAMREARDSIALLLRVAGLLAPDAAVNVMVDARKQVANTIDSSFTVGELRRLLDSGSVLSDAPIPALVTTDVQQIVAPEPQIAIARAQNDADLAGLPGDC